MNLPDVVRYGDWINQGDCEFYILGNDITIIRSDGASVTTFPYNDPGTIHYVEGLPQLYL